MAIKKNTAQQPQSQSAVQAEPQKKSFADLFDKTKPGGGFMPVGKHTCYLTSLEVEGKLDGEDKLKVKVTFEGAEDEEEGVSGKSLSSWYSLRSEDGEPMGGIGFLKRDLEILGYADISLSDLEELCSTITNERLKVVINVKQNGQYTNAYLQGLAEG